MVLPHTPCQRREVQICVARSCYARDVDTNVVVVDLCDDCVAEAVPCHTEHAYHAVEAPDGHCGPDPAFVAPLVRETEEDVVIAAGDGQD